MGNSKIISMEDDSASCQAPRGTAYAIQHIWVKKSRVNMPMLTSLTLLSLKDFMICGTKAILEVTLATIPKKSHK